VRLYSRPGNDMTRRFPLIAEFCPILRTYQDEHPGVCGRISMAELPYTDESARAILLYWARHVLRPGDKTPRWALEQHFFENPRFRREDFEAGLSYALEKQWLVQDGETFALTGSGFEMLPEQ
jgi:hypothetical protein